MAQTVLDAAVRAAVAVAARFGITGTEPAVLTDGANIAVHLRSAPVVAKVAASTPAVRRDNQDWLQRELDLSAFLAADGAPVVPPSQELPAITHHDHGHVMSFWRYLPPADPALPPRPDEETIGSMLRDLHAARRLRAPQPGPSPPSKPRGRGLLRRILADVLSRRQVPDQPGRHPAGRACRCPGWTSRSRSGCRPRSTSTGSTHPPDRRRRARPGRRLLGRGPGGVRFLIRSRLLTEAELAHFGLSAPDLVTGPTS